MLKFFRKNKVDINSLAIPDFNWSITKENSTIKQWINPVKTIALSVNFFDAEPDIPSLKKIDPLRNFYRDQIVQQNGGLIEVSVLDTKGYETVRTI